METVACYCLKCKAELGRFRNSWNRIGNTYFSPVHPPLSVEGFENTGDIYEAAQGSQIQDSLLQDLACGACRHVLGLRCDSAPDGHLLRQHQLILRLAEMTVVSEESGAGAKISIMKTYPLTNPTVRARTQSVLRRTPISRFTPCPKPPSLLPGISRTPSTISRQATPVKTAPQIDVAKFKSWMESAISSQQKDIDRLSGSVERIERDMRQFRGFMDEIRAELGSNRQLQAERENESFASVRGELDSLRQQFNSNPRPVSRGSFGLSNQSLDIIADDLQEVGRKVDEIDELKTELERLKARLFTFENAETTLMETELQTSVTERGSGRKRKNTHINDSEPSSHRDQLEWSAKRRFSSNTPIDLENSDATRSNSVLPGPQIEARSQMAVEIVSKEALHSMSPSQVNEGQFDYGQNEVDDDYEPPYPTTPVSAIIRSVEKGRDSTPPNEDSTPLSERILNLDKIIEPDLRMRELDVQLGRQRTSCGFLLTKDGKVDRRSLRYVGDLGDQGNEILSRWSMAPETPVHRVARIQLPDASEFPVLPSIEHFESILATTHPQLRSSSRSCSITPRDYKPFKCGACKKSYRNRSGLKYHTEHAKTAACRQVAGNVSPEQFICDTCNGKFVDLQRLDKHQCGDELGIQITLQDPEGRLAYREETAAAHDATLTERERLVRQTLDRELSVAL